MLSLGGYADIFLRNTLASGVVPQISAIMGPCAGGAVYSPAITDFTIMVRDTSYMFVTGPEVVKTVTHEDVTKEQLGGAHDAQREQRRGAFRRGRRSRVPGAAAELLSYMPGNNVDDPPLADRRRSADREDAGAGRARAGVADAAVRHARRAHAVVDDGYVPRSARALRQNIIVGFARLGGRPVGIVANQPAHLAGTLDIDASVKGARFVRFCDAFNIPLVTFEDVPGFLPGLQQEFGGIIRHGAKLLYRVCRGHRPEGDGHHAQGLWRRVLRDGEQAHPHRRRTSPGRRLRSPSWVPRAP